MTGLIYNRSEDSDDQSWNAQEVWPDRGVNRFLLSFHFNNFTGVEKFQPHASHRRQITALLAGSFSKGICSKSACCPRWRLPSMRRLLQSAVHLSHVDEKQALSGIWHVPPSKLQGFPNRSTGHSRGSDCRGYMRILFQKIRHPQYVIIW